MVLLDFERFIISRQWLRFEAFFFVVPDGGRVVLPKHSYYRVSVAIASFHAMTSASTRYQSSVCTIPVRNQFEASVCCVVFAELPEVVF